MPTSYALQVAGTLGEINIGARLAVAGLLPLIAQLDAMLGAQFGLGALQADLAAQLQAYLSVSIEVSDPTALLTAALKGLLTAVAQIEAALAAGIVPPSIQISASATLALVAALQAKLGGISALLDLTAGVRLAAVGLVGELTAALSVGPAALYAATNQTLTAALGQISGHDYSDAGFAPGDTVTVVVIVSKAPGFYAGAQILFPLPPA